MLSAAAELIPNAFQDSDATDTDEHSAAVHTAAGHRCSWCNASTPTQCTAVATPVCCTQLGSRGGCSGQQLRAMAVPGLWSHQSHAHAKADDEGPAGASRCRAWTRGSNFPALPWGGSGPARPHPLSAGSQGAQKQLHELTEPGERGDSQPLPTQEAAEHSPVSLLHRLVKCAN